MAIIPLPKKSSSLFKYPSGGMGGGDEPPILKVVRVADAFSHRPAVLQAAHSNNRISPCLPFV